MTNGREKSDPAIVAVKQANKAGEPAAEPVERRAGAKGNAGQERTLRTQGREGAPQGLDRVRQARARFAVKHPRQEPYAGKPLVRICAGGAQ
jgi:hypothetical protein